MKTDIISFIIKLKWLEERHVKVKGFLLKMFVSFSKLLRNYKLKDKNTKSIAVL